MSLKIDDLDGVKVRIEEIISEAFSILRDEASDNLLNAIDDEYTAQLILNYVLARYTK